MGKLPKPNKDLGQHFLKDQKVIYEITHDHHQSCDVIVEVGPGPAILSYSLSKHNKPYFFIEKDQRFIQQLEQITKEENMFFQDALEFDWKAFIEKNNLTTKKIWLVSNLPYNVSSPLFLSFIQIPQIKCMTLMFQKEVGEKTFYRQHEKNQMSSLLCISQNYFDSKLLLKVLPGAFNPPPKVDSVVVSYERKQKPHIDLSDFSNFESFLRILFQMKRKQLGTVLKNFIPKNKKDEFFTQSAVESTLRAEALTLDQVYSLYNSYKTMK